MFSEDVSAVDEIVATITIPPNVRIVRFSVSHILLMDLDPWQQSLIESYPDYLPHLEARTQTGAGYTYLIEGKPSLSFGIVPVWQGVADAWMIRDNVVSQYAVSVCRGARLFFDLVPVTLQLHRLQFTVAKANITAIKFAEFLKFRREGLLREYTPNHEDYIAMARIYEE
tara:strand:- start:1264 stop:1773 length:510 start_codon:yes stop_codon:yes gene_type:complete